MTSCDVYLIRFLCGAVLLAGAGTRAQAADPKAAEPKSASADSYARSVTFKLTFSNRDLVWQGDPGSPTSIIHLKPAARPIATDACVTTLVTSTGTPARRLMREARIVKNGDLRTVLAFTKEREKEIGAIDTQGHFTPNDFYAKRRDLLPSWPADASVLKYDARENALFYETDEPSARVTERLDFLPLDLLDQSGAQAAGSYAIHFRPATGAGAAAKPAGVSLQLAGAGQPLTLATADLPKWFRRADAQLGSFDNRSGAYLAESAYRAGAKNAADVDPSVTFTITGQLASAVRADGPRLALTAAQNQAQTLKPVKPQIKIDDNFDDWRNVTGVDDPRGDLAPYLDYLPDTDLLEFKVANDAEHIYLYARVAGQVGRTHTTDGRSYFYAYMDVDQNPETGFIPSRDDDCYYGVDLGDDCEVQFEFVDSTLRKTFYGFCGLGGDENILKQVVTRGKSNYGRLDDDGNERANYKGEYILRGGAAEITEDLKLGTSDTIRMALSPDGSEVEITSTLKGFLKDANGKPTVGLGQKIDVAAGMECSGSKVPGEKSRWSADSTIILRGYELKAP